MRQWSGAATAIASGIIALVLSSIAAGRLPLTPRDVTHLIVMGSEVAPLADNGDTWTRNAAGFWLSLDFGFGLLNAENMVNLAKDMRELPKLHTCSVVKAYPDIQPPENNVLHSIIKFNGCEGKSINFLEQIEVEVSLEDLSKDVSQKKEPSTWAWFLGYFQNPSPVAQRRVAARVELTSPELTKTVLLEPLDEDKRHVVLQWSFKSYQNWGENSNGDWQLHVALQEQESAIRVSRVTLTLHGTADRPALYAATRPYRTYSAFRLADEQTSEDPMKDYIDIES